MSSDWRCDLHGPIVPFRVPQSISKEILEAALLEAWRAGPDVDPEAGATPAWCPWPLPSGWMMTGVGWAGDERSGVQATLVACSGPNPVGGPADVVFIAEELAVGLGARFAGLAGSDPGPDLLDTLKTTPAQAKVKAAGWSTPLWSVESPEDRSVYVGQAKGMWLWAVAWPAEAGYLLAEDVVLHDLTESVPPELVYGAPSPYLRGPGQLG